MHGYRSKSYVYSFFLSSNSLKLLPEVSHVVFSVSVFFSFSVHFLCRRWQMQCTSFLAERSRVLANWHCLQFTHLVDCYILVSNGCHGVCLQISALWFPTFRCWFRFRWHFVIRLQVVKFDVHC